MRSLGPARKSFVLKAFGGELSDDDAAKLDDGVCLFDFVDGQAQTDDYKTSGHHTVMSAEVNLQYDFLEKSGWSYFMKGTGLTQMGRYDEGIFYYDFCLKKEPRSVYAMQEKAVCLFRCKKLDEAIHCYVEALDIFDRDPLLHLELAYLYQHKGESQLVESHIQQAHLKDAALRRRMSRYEFGPKVCRYYEKYLDLPTFLKKCRRRSSAKATDSLANKAMDSDSDN